MYSAAQLHMSAAVGGSLQGTKVKPVGLSTRKTEAVLFTFLAEQFSRADISPTTASHLSYVNHSPSHTDCRLSSLALWGVWFIQQRFTVQVRKVISGPAETEPINSKALRCKQGREPRMSIRGQRSQHRHPQIIRSLSSASCFQHHRMRRSLQNLLWMGSDEICSN